MPDLIQPESLAVIIAVLAAGLFGLLAQTAKRGLASVDPHSAALIIITVASAMFWLCAPLWLQPAHLFTTGFWWFCATGLLHPMLSMYCALEATSRTHASVAATLTSTAPLFAAVAAMFMLDEDMTLPILLGTLATIVGIATLSWAPRAIRGIMLSAVAFATVTAIVRGVTQSTGKYGLSLVHDPPLAAAVSFTVSAIGTAIIFYARGKRIGHVSKVGMRWFLVSGILNSAGIFCMYVALGLGKVTVVAPIIGSAPVFTMLFGRLLFGERLTWRAIGGIVLVVAGVLLLSMTTQHQATAA